MSLFNNKKMNGIELTPTDYISFGFDTARKIANGIVEDNTPKQDDSEWVWVKGYKGTDKDMRCHGGYQFELAKQFDMPDGAKIEACASGFHLCLDLRDVFDYYNVGNGNRFFEVRALVRKKDYARYGKSNSPHDYILWNPSMANKLAARSIIFMRELTRDEVLTERIHLNELKTWTDEDKDICMLIGFDAVHAKRRTRTLTELGYSEPLADFIVKTNKYDLAFALGSQPNLTMADICHILFGDKKG